MRDTDAADNGCYDWNPAQRNCCHKSIFLSWCHFQGHNLGECKRHEEEVHYDVANGVDVEHRDRTDTGCLDQGIPHSLNRLALEDTDALCGQVLVVLEPG